MSWESKKFGKKMRELRQHKHLTQLEIALKTGLDLTTINEIENGHREPMLGTIRKIQKVLGSF